MGPSYETLLVKKRKVLKFARKERVPHNSKPELVFNRQKGKRVGGVKKRGKKGKVFPVRNAA